jgi:hypothetical protein
MALSNTVPFGRIAMPLPKPIASSLPDGSWTPFLAGQGQCCHLYGATVIYTVIQMHRNGRHSET